MRSLRSHMVVMFKLDPDPLVLLDGGNEFVAPIQEVSLTRYKPIDTDG